MLRRCPRRPSLDTRFALRDQSNSLATKKTVRKPRTRQEGSYTRVEYCRNAPTVSFGSENKNNYGSSIGDKSCLGRDPLKTRHLKKTATGITVISEYLRTTSFRCPYRRKAESRVRHPVIPVSAWCMNRSHRPLVTSGPALQYRACPHNVCSMFPSPIPNCATRPSRKRIKTFAVISERSMQGTDAVFTQCILLSSNSSSPAWCTVHRSAAV